MVKKKKKAVAAAAAKAARRSAKEQRRKRDRGRHVADMWDGPAPPGLVAKLDLPKSKYRSYFEFAENTEKKKKKLEFTVTNDRNAPPGFEFIPIGDPTLTNACKELSREAGAMIFIVSGTKEQNSKISEHIHRVGYHFRITIVDQARGVVGETLTSRTAKGSERPEPIPQSQDEINKQADAAIRDLFPRIPNTDRQMVIEHAFQKGAMFHGEPTVGLQPDIPLSRRVQLAVLAHIRHTHTRYDKLLRETSWVNARKAVESLCLDVLVKWRGDEETGRDQMDEILREVVVITDSESEDDSSDEDSSSEEEEGEVISLTSSDVAASPPTQREQQNAAPLSIRDSHPRPAIARGIDNEEFTEPGAEISSRTNSKFKHVQKSKKAQRGFKRYQAAWDEALNRRKEPSIHADTPSEGPAARMSRPPLPSPHRELDRYPVSTMSNLRFAKREYRGSDQDERYNDRMDITRQNSYYLQHGPAPRMVGHGDEVIVRPLPERSIATDVRPLHDQDDLLHPSTSTCLSKEQRRPQPLRGSPVRHGLQDMLVPSIETAPGDVMIASSRSEASHPGRFDGFDQPPEACRRRMVDSTRISPARRRVVAINEDGQQVKRRRLVHEDDSGHFRVVPRPDVHIMPASSIHSRDLLVRRPSLLSSSGQGLFREAQLSSTRPVVAAPMHDYGLPDPSAITSGRFKVTDFDFGPQREVRPIMRQLGRDESFLGMANETALPNQLQKKVRQVEHDRVTRPVEPHFSPRKYIQRPASPLFPVSSRPSRSHEMSTGPVIANQSSIHNLSQSRHEPPFSQSRDSLSALAFERSLQDSISRGNNIRPYEDQLARSFTALRPAQTRSPVQYIERPMHYREESSPQPVFYKLNDAQIRDRYRPEATTWENPSPPASGVGSVPTYVRTMPPKQVIVLE